MLEKCSMTTTRQYKLAQGELSEERFLANSDFAYKTKLLYHFSVALEP